MKLSLLFLFTSTAFANNCETFTGYQLKEKLCWDKSLRGWVSARCIKENCEAKSKAKMPARPANSMGQNPAAMACHDLKLDVVILRDSQNDEQSFCQFKDKSLIDTNALVRNLK